MNVSKTFLENGPAEKKRELCLHLQLQKIRLLQMANDDTPLGFGGALRDATRRTGVAHVVLSRPSLAPLRSAFQRNSLAKVEKSTELAREYIYSCTSLLHHDLLVKVMDHASDFGLVGQSLKRLFLK